MLAPDELSAGPFASATPLSLILPRTQYETPALIGTINGSPAAVFLSGQFAFHCFMSADNHSWQGLIVPRVRIEVDESSVFDPDYGSAGLGVMVRRDTVLAIRARMEHGFGQSTSVTLHEGLSSSELKAGFTQWQVVIGSDVEKRVLWRTPPPADTPASGGA